MDVMHENDDEWDQCTHKEQFGSRAEADSYATTAKKEKHLLEREVQLEISWMPESWSAVDRCRKLITLELVEKYVGTCHIMTIHGSFSFFRQTGCNTIPDPWSLRHRLTDTKGDEKKHTTCEKSTTWKC